MESPATTTRIGRWTQQLLDLSLRNRLLNTRDCKQVLPLACEEIGRLEDRLAAGGVVPLVSAAAQTAGNAGLCSALGVEDTQRRLREIYRLAKTDLEETGVNALYLAVGFL